MMKNKVLEFAITRHYFEDSIRFGFDYFKFVFDNLIPTFKDIREDWSHLLNQHYSRELSAKKAIEKLDKWFINLVKKKEIDDWLDIATLLGRNTLADLFFKIHKHLDDKSYWMLLGKCYTNSYIGFEETIILKYFFISTRKHREFIMNEDERKQFELLPEQLTIYRGCSKAEINSKKYRFSWTLNRDVAKFFANEYHRNAGVECDILELIVKKENLLAYFNDKEEEEVIYIT